MDKIIRIDKINLNPMGDRLTFVAGESHAGIVTGVLK